MAPAGRNGGSADIAAAVTVLNRFIGGELTGTIGAIERSLQGVSAGNCAKALTTAGVEDGALAAAAQLKRAAGQINVVIHALGILLCLPHILQPGEIIEYVSLGAGNTGRAFDLETDRRIAEFKFIHWQGGAESIARDPSPKPCPQQRPRPAREAQRGVLRGVLNALQDRAGLLR